MNYFDFNARKAGVDPNATDVIQLTDTERAALENEHVIIVETSDTMTDVQVDVWLKNFNR